MNSILGSITEVGHHLIRPISVLQLSKCLDSLTFSGLILSIFVVVGVYIFYSSFLAFIVSVSLSCPNLPTMILGWNCQGICNASTVRALKAQIKGSKPNVVFLSEIKANETRMEEVKNSIGFSGKIVVDAKGKMGGLCLMWKWGVNVEVEKFNKNILVVKIKEALCEWLMVGFHGPPYPAKKRKAWENICAILESFQGPWVCLGDFNYIVNAEEKCGGDKGGTLAPNYLKELMFDLGAIDLGYSGNKFTWAKGRWGSATIKERLDRGLASISWRLVFPKASVQHLGTLNSDHLPIL